MEVLTKHAPPPCSLGYKPFLSLIRPQLQQLMEVVVEQVQPEVFQPANPSKLGAEGGTPPPRAAEASLSRGGASGLGMALTSMAPPGAFPRPAEDRPLEEQVEQVNEEGAYDCTLS